MRLQGQTAIITGSGRGIGQDIALAFAKEGANVVVSDIDPVTTQQSAELVARSGHATGFRQMSHNARMSNIWSSMRWIPMDALIFWSIMPCGLCPAVSKN